MADIDTSIDNGGDIELGAHDEEQQPLNDEKSDEPEKKTRFADPKEDPEVKKPGAIEVSDIEDPSASLRPKKNNRATTLSKVRKTLSEGAKETADVISDASSFSLANNVETILWAMQESGEEKWGLDDLNLSEAFMLFWRSDDGGIDGRKTSASLQALAYGTMLADLTRLDKITAQKMNKKVGPVKYEKYVIHPTSDLELDNYLDEALIDIIDQHGEGKRKTIAKYVEDVATSFSEGAIMVDAVLESLCEKKILNENISSRFGQTSKKYSLGENKAVFENLLTIVRETLLDDGVEASPFITFLLRFIRQADKEYFLRTPFMNHVLKNKMERTKAKNKYGGSLVQFDKLKGEKK